MEKVMKFNSQIGTTKEQSERLLALGLKKKTADMYYPMELEGGELPVIADAKFGPPAGTLPAWSLHRLIELYKDVEDTSMWSLDYITYGRLIKCIDLAIKHGDFNKEYLEEKGGENEVMHDTRPDRQTD